MLLLYYYIIFKRLYIVKDLISINNKIFITKEEFNFSINKLINIFTF